VLSVVSVCSGAGGKDLGFARAGCRIVALCEVDQSRRRMLARNFPGVPCWPDLTELDPAELPDADMLIGGTPCQDLSHAGRRAGLDGSRSGLFWDFMRVRNARGYEWCVWENVEGALSSNAGLDFACVLGAFVGADVVAPADGWPGAGVVAGPWGGCVWRVLDAQHFGVPQRRRRVFVVGRLGGPCPPEVLLERSSGGGDLASRGGQGSRPATAVAERSGIARCLNTNERYDGDSESFVIGSLGAKNGERGGWRFGADEAAAGQLVPALVSRSSRGKPTPLAPGHNGTDEHIVAHALTAIGFDASEDGTGRGTPLVPDGVRAADGLARRLDGAGVRPFVKTHTTNGGDDPDRWSSAEVARSLSPMDLRHPTNPNLLIVGEGEAGVCAVDPQPDGRRYSACGDGVVAPVAEWIARRLIWHSEPGSNAAPSPGALAASERTCKQGDTPEGRGMT
jgi:DNA (cytosine-5)-methyltransferase 1